MPDGLPHTVVRPMPVAPPDPDPLVREIADTLYRIQVNYEREGSGTGSRFEGETLETVQARWVIRRVRHAIAGEAHDG